MHISGLLGMPRRISTYSGDQGWDLWNMLSSIGAFTIATSVLIFIINVIYSLRRGEPAGNDPWDGRTLEWTIPSPPPHYNFEKIPVVHTRDPFWHDKYTEDEQGRPIPVVAGAANGHEEEGHGGGHGIHMPSPSYFPLIAALGFPIMATGFIYDYALVAVGAVVLFFGIYAWAMEPPTEPEGQA
jgi:cytochrome c oxidase subunit 1